jgi:hypothetical protein
MTAFSYPANFIRRHGPQGYADYASYRDWLRDDFSFRCVYCLQRERWVRGTTVFVIDHLHPAAHHPSIATDYDNLLYACSTCNARKNDVTIPDPTTVFLHTAVSVDPDGRIQPTTREARKIVKVLDLDGPEATEYRAKWLAVLRLAAEHDRELYAQYMGFPDDLPDLTRAHPPNNARPGGVDDSYHARRLRGELPETY